MKIKIKIKKKNMPRLSTHEIFQWIVGILSSTQVPLGGGGGGMIFATFNSIL